MTIVNLKRNSGHTDNKQTLITWRVHLKCGKSKLRCSVSVKYTLDSKELGERRNVNNRIKIPTLNTCGNGNI